MRRIPDGQEVIDNEQDDEVAQLVRHAVSAGINYYETKKSDHVLLKWVLGVASTLAAASIIGAITLYGQVSGLTEKINAQQRQLDRIENQLAARHAAP